MQILDFSYVTTTTRARSHCCLSVTAECWQTQREQRLVRKLLDFFYRRLRLNTVRYRVRVTVVAVLRLYSMYVLYVHCTVYTYSIARDFFYNTVFNRMIMQQCMYQCLQYVFIQILVKQSLVQCILQLFKSPQCTSILYVVYVLYSVQYCTSVHCTLLSNTIFQCCRPRTVRGTVQEGRLLLYVLQIKCFCSGNFSLLQ